MTNSNDWRSHVIPKQAAAAVWYKHGQDAIVQDIPVQQPDQLKPGEVSQAGVTRESTS
jgi:hypothetical protein